MGQKAKACAPVSRWLFLLVALVLVVTPCVVYGEPEVDGSDGELAAAVGAVVPDENVDESAAEDPGADDAPLEAQTDEGPSSFVIGKSEDWNTYWNATKAYETVRVSGDVTIDTFMLRNETTKLIVDKDVTLNTKHFRQGEHDDPARRTQQATLDIDGEGTININVTDEKDTESAFKMESVNGPQLSINGCTININQREGGAALSLATWDNKDSKASFKMNGGTLLVTNAAEFGQGISTDYDDCWGDITICGGTLEVHANNALHAYGDITIEGGQVTAETNGSGSGIYCYGGDFKMTGGTLSARGNNGAGIGVSEDHTITISGGVITSATSSNGAGIGGTGGSDKHRPQFGNGEVIIEEGAIIECASSINGAGIGNGFNASGGKVTINGGKIKRASSVAGAGIGGGLNGSIDSVTINDGDVCAYSLTGDSGGQGDDQNEFGASGAGIGGGNNSDKGSSDDGAFSVVINGGTVEAYGCGAGIGDGEKGAGGKVSITGGNVRASSYATAANIGSAYLGGPVEVSITGGTVNAGAFTSEETSISDLLNGRDGGDTAGAGIGSGQYSKMATVTISGDYTVVEARCQHDGAGIGAGSHSNGANVTIAAGSVTATSEGKGAGIGAGNFSGKSDQGGVEAQDDAADEVAYGDTVSIAGGTVCATSEGGGAGIGSAQLSSPMDVSISGGTVTACAYAAGAQAIGHGTRVSQSGDLTLGYPSEDGQGSVPAKVWKGGATGEGGAQVVTVSDGVDGRVDACRSPWAKVEHCAHDGGNYGLHQVDDTYHAMCCEFCATRELTQHESEIKFDENDHWRICGVCGWISAHEPHEGASAQSPYCAVCGYEYLGTTYTVTIPNKLEVAGAKKYVSVADVHIGKEDRAAGITAVQVSADDRVTLTSGGDGWPSIVCDVDFPVMLVGTAQEVYQPVGLAEPESARAGSYAGVLTFTVGLVARAS